MQLLTSLLIALLTFTLTAAVYAEGKASSRQEDEMLVIEKKPKTVSVPRTFGSSRLRDWFVLDNRNLVVEVTGGRKYKATLMGACHGLRFTDAIGFETSGPFELDRWTTIHLPDGETCYVKELTPYDEEADRN